MFSHSTVMLRSKCLPLGVIIFFIALCLLPFLINIIDTNLVISKYNSNAVLGELLHTVMESTTVVIAALTAVLAFIHYLVTKNPVTPIISLALFFGGVMDIFHLFMEKGAVSAVKSQNEWIYFSWSLSRFFNAFICLVGVGVIILKDKTTEIRDHQFIFFTAIFLSILCGLSIYFCMTLEYLPSFFMARPGEIYRYPDFITFFLFCLTGYVFCEFFRIYPSPFISALILSVLPNLLCEFYMLHSEIIQFDETFYIAHFFKVLAYLIPFVGISYEYIETYKREKESESLLAGSKKYAALGQMASGIAHEINNPLSIISGHISLLKSKAENDKLTKEYAVRISQRIDHTVERIVGLVNSLRRYSRNDTSIPFKKIPISHILSDAYNLSCERPKRYKIDFRIQSRGFDHVEVLCRDLEISQVLLNLLNNSVDAVKDLDERWILLSVAKTRDYFMEIIVTDSGKRPDTELIPNIFDPFFTTKGIGQGTGLGLSICKSIVDAHGGDLFLNQDSDNTQFIFSLKMA